MARPRADVGKAKRLEQLADRALVIGDAEAVLNNPLKVDPPPTHDTVNSPIRSRLDKLSQIALLIDGQARWIARRPGVLQPVRAAFVEPVHPVPQRLTIHAADPRRIRPVHPVQNRRQRQQAATLIGVLARSCQATKLSR